MFGLNRKEWLVMVIVGLISLVMAYGFWICPKGGLLSNGLLNEGDFYYRSEHTVRGLRSKGFEGGDQFSFVVPFGKNFSTEDLKRLLQFHNQVVERFAEYGVLSLARAVRYEKTGSLGDPYVHEELLDARDFNLERWKDMVRSDPGVFEVLIGKNFDYAQVIVFLSYDYNELDIRNRVASLLEKREVSTWEWFLKNDISPAGEYEDILVSGWPFGRGLMDAALISDILKYSTIGLILVVLVLYPLLGSWRQALYSWVLIILALFWVRGTIGLLGLAGIKVYGEIIKERVYVLLAFTAVIIAGISFASRKFDAFNSFEKGDRRQRWKQTRWFDGKIYIVAVIAIANFLSLCQIEIRGIVEMGILSSIGIFYLVIMTKWLLPAMQIVFGGEVESHRKNKAMRLGAIFLQKVTRTCFKILIIFSPRKTFAIFCALTVLVVGGACAVAVHDYYAHLKGANPLIKIGTNPIDYLPDTIVDKARQFLNQPDRYGFGKLTFLIRFKDGQMHDPDIIRKVRELEEEAAEIDGVRTAKSIIDTVKVISERQYGLEFPENEKQLTDIFTTIDWDLGNLISSQLWYEHGINLVLSLSADDSNKLEEQCEQLLFLVENNFPDLEAIPFGRLHYYHRTDKYIREKASVNVITSFWIVVVFAAVWIHMRSRAMDNRGRSYYLSSWKTGMAMAVPFAFASSCMIYLMVFYKIPLDQATACIMALAVNAAIDFNLHLVDDFNEAMARGHDFREGLWHALCEKGGINIVDILVNALCFSMLIFSVFVPISRLGWLLSVMMFACGFGALIIMPAMLYKCIGPAGADEPTAQAADRLGTHVKTYE